MTQDLVVISFERDIPLLNVFVKSVDKFVTENFFKNLWLVITDDTPIEKFTEIRKSKFNWNIVYAKELFEVHQGHGLSGYINQQLSKLCIAKKIKSDWYWLFDSKNFILKNISEQDLYSENRAYIGLGDPIDYWQPGYLEVLNRFKLDYQTPIINTTPYPIHTSTMNLMLEEVTDFQNLFCNLYLDKKTCEFFYYNAFVFKKKMFDKLYHPHGRFRFTIWPAELEDPESQPEVIKEKLEKQQDFNYIWCGGLHRTAVAAMNDIQKDKWADFLVWIEFFNNKKEVYSWFEEVIKTGQLQ